MERSRRSIAVLVLGSLVLAQAPTPPPSAPAAATKVVFSAAEAQAFVFCLELAESMQGVQRARQRNHEALSGYVAHSVEIPKLESEPVLPVSSEGPVARLVYVLPQVATEGTRRVFCVRGDGVIAYSDNTVGTALRDGRTPEDADVLGEGGPRSVRNFPRSPTRGQDGNLWMPGDMVKTTRANVRVVDEDGAPFALVRVHCVAGGAGGVATLDVVLPAGRAVTRIEGDAVLVGVPARGLGFVLEFEGVPVPVPTDDIRIEGNNVRIQAPRAAMQLARMRRNESAAIATLKNISSAQAQCQASGVIDTNKNGAGEYGMFAELSGRDAVRGGEASISPPVLSTAFSKVSDGVVTRSGYCFRMFLPGKDAVAVAERTGGGADPAAIDALQAETLWACYAWPVQAGVSGQRAFFINQSGDVLAMQNKHNAYGGAGKGPAATAAFEAKSTGHMNAAVAGNRDGRDGAQWVVVH